MAKIDTSQIENYENLSVEDKLKALEEFEYNDNSGELAKANKELERFKNSITKLTSENADWKRKYNEKLTDEERKEQEAKAKQEELEKNYATLLKEKELNSTIAKYTTLGYSLELATETAEAQINNDFAKVMENQRKFIELHDKEVIANAMGKTPAPKSGEPKNNDITLDDFRKKPIQERLDFAKKYPEEYRKLYENA